MSDSNLTTALAILQQSEYDFRVLKDWVIKHKLEEKAVQPNQSVKPDKWTLKLQMISGIARGLFFLPLLSRIKIALALISIPQYLTTQYILWQASQKLRAAQKRGLIVVAIAGSYAKTSTKHWLHHLLSQQISVLYTKKSINTPLGIARTILNNLTEEHAVCIIELGEYYKGDVEKLAQFVQPDFGILTPIGTQHLERMGSLESIASTIEELLIYFEKQPTNQVKSSQIKCKHVISAIENKPFFADRVEYYGVETQNISPEWKASLSQVSKSGTEGTISTASGKSWKVFTPLYGVHQFANALPAFWLAHSLKSKSGSVKNRNVGSEIEIDLSKIAQSTATMQHISQRHEPHFSANDVLILDNSYNTNPESFQTSLELLKQLKPTRSFVITLGFVELGDKSAEIHQQLGKTLAKKVEFVGVIDSVNAQTIVDSFVEHGGKESHIITAKTPEACMLALQKEVIPGSIILFEGGYREVLA